MLPVLILSIGEMCLDEQFVPHISRVLCCRLDFLLEFFSKQEIIMATTAIEVSTNRLFRYIKDLLSQFNIVPQSFSQGKKLGI